MSSDPQKQIRPTAEQLDAVSISQWQALWEPLAARLRSGHSGLRLSEALAERTDAHVVSHAEQMAVPWDGLALLAVGGYGRGQLAPGSDVDLLLLHRWGNRKRAEQLAASLVPLLWDHGLRVGVATRTVRDCERLARTDLSCLTNTLSARYLCGDRALAERLLRTVRRWPQRRWARRQLRLMAQEVLDRPPYPPVHILAPDLKEGAGGLRDIHRIGWFRSLVRGTELEAELDRVVCIEEDELALAEAEQLLWSLRWWLHILRPRPSNRLDRDIQLTLARQLGFSDTPQSMGVEKLMRSVYRSMSRVAAIVRRMAAFLAASPRESPVSVAIDDCSLKVHRSVLVANDYPELRRLRRDLTAQLQVLHLAAARGLELGADLLRELLRAPTLPESDRLPGRRAFWAMLRGSPSLGTLLRVASDTGVLSRLIPEWEHVRGLVQFTEYHEYTVDEHSIVAVEHAVALAGEQSDLGRVYQATDRKQLLHLALLIHDLGKGYRQDHSVVGADIARAVARSFQLAPDEAELLAFLVRHHLLLSHTAFRRDIEHPGTLAEVAQRIGTAERLDLLYLLTVCDIRAAGPGRMTGWKMDLLSETYRRLRALLAGEETAEAMVAQAVARRRARLCELGRDRGERFSQWVASLPVTYVMGTEPEQLLHDYVRLIHLPRRSVDVVVETARPGVHCVTVYAYNRRRLFADIVTGLYVAGTSVIEARIATLPDDTVVDRFVVHDLVEDSAAARRERIRACVLAAIHESTDPERLLEQVPFPLRRRPTVAVYDPEVRIDTTVSPDCTVIDVFFQDAPGVLYRLSRTLYALGLDIVYAKIAVYGDRVVDVFYVVDESGSPLRDAGRWRRVRHELLATLQGLRAARHA